MVAGIAVGVGLLEIGVTEVDIRLTASPNAATLGDILFTPLVCVYGLTVTGEVCKSLVLTTFVCMQMAKKTKQQKQQKKTKTTKRRNENQMPIFSSYFIQQENTMRDSDNLLHVAFDCLILHRNL